REYEEVLEMLEEFGFENGWTQEFSATDIGRPDFASAAPFAWEGDFAPAPLHLTRAASPAPSANGSTGAVGASRTSPS
ncbi:MAG: hypothetical protein ACREKA_05190, partial [Candidatus Methylomirabilales bacterium]